MILQSTRLVNARPEHIWPYFFNAKMDDRYPLAFRLGLPKPIECRIIDGDGTPGSIRRCITTRGNMDQTILEADPYRKFSYELVTSSYWGQPFISSIRDEITLEPAGPDQTRITRVTHFQGRGWPQSLITLVMRLGFMQAHRYAHENWQRLALHHAA